MFIPAILILIIEGLSIKRPVVLQNVFHIWKMIDMKKVILAAIICLLAASLYAQNAKEVSLRFSRQDNATRIVIESDENFIREATTVYTLSSVRVSFPAPVELKKQNDFIFDIISKDRFLLINLKDAVDIRVYKLTAPGRIVIDLKTKPVLGSAGTPEQKAGKSLHQTAKEALQEIFRTFEKKPPLKVVVIDVGHGGYDYGIIAEKEKEKDINLLLAKELSAALAKNGKKIFLTRKVDQAISIEDRIGFVAKNNPNAFVSIHASTSDRFSLYISSAYNQETDVTIGFHSLSSRQNRHIEESRSLAGKITEELNRDLETEVLFREMPLPILSSIDAPAILIEYPSPGFLTYDKTVISTIVNAIIKGMAAYEQ